MAISKWTISVLLLIGIFLALAENLMKVLRAQCIVHDPSTIQNVTCWAKPFNRSVSVVNISGNVVRLLNDVLINFKLFKRSEVRFRPFFVNVMEDFCDFMAMKSKSQYLRLATSIYMPYTNMNHTCPYIGHLYVKDLPLDANYNLPALWAIGEYRLDILVLCKRRKIITIEYYFEIKVKPRPR